MQDQSSTTVKLCECGCERPAPIATATDRRYGWVKGEPKRFIAYHHFRPYRARYVVEDRGYTTPCHIWQGAMRNGYGLCRSGSAHRAMWVDAYGPLSSDIDVHHLCKQRACINLDHLEAIHESDHLSGHAKVSTEQVAEIRARHIPRVVTAKMLAAEYGVSVGCIKKILAGNRR